MKTNNKYVELQINKIISSSLKLFKVTINSKLFLSGDDYKHFMLYEKF